MVTSGKDQHSSLSCSTDFSFRNLIYQVSGEELLSLLDKEKLCVYAGFDPTASSLHLGNLLQLCNLKRLQDYGHRPIVVLGGGTAMIGDPGGKSTERNLLSSEEIEENIKGVLPQLEQFLDFSSTKKDNSALLVNNASWLNELRLTDFLRDIGKHMTVGQMVAKESVRSRIERPEQGISFTEFTYMLLQGYDFLQLYKLYGCNVQLGGSDQWGNITVGIDLIGKIGAAKAYGLTSPLVVKADGTKFGKSEQGAIYLDKAKTTPFALYQYLLRSEDEVVGAYLRYFTFLDHDTILDLDHKRSTNPKARDSQYRLADEVCRFIHGSEETEKVLKASKALYADDVALLTADILEAVSGDVPKTALGIERCKAGVSIVDVLEEAGLAKSKKDARTIISQGGAYLNNLRITDSQYLVKPEDFLEDRYVLLRRGRKEVHLLELSQ
ncbi:MAG: tyrosine--tRNA ligase [Firmicutes bacterium]|jgi:tyrosyl-tRNA synthetase|nr:tyrosine--tRNA ligase [Bacillota bacterium]